MTSIKATPTKVKRFSNFEWQLYWKDWWHVWPWLRIYPRDEDGPAEIYLGISALQMHWFVWDNRK